MSVLDRGLWHSCEGSAKEDVSVEALAAVLAMVLAVVVASNVVLLRV